NWSTYYDSTNRIVNMIPGNKSTLNQPYLFNNYDSTNAKYNVTVTFWEYLNRTTYFTLINDTFNAFVNPLSVENGTIKHVFYELSLHCVDHDGLNAKDITVSLINATDGT